MKRKFTFSVYVNQKYASEAASLRSLYKNRPVVYSWCRHHSYPTNYERGLHFFTGCPTSFNKLTPAWFLNHSENPNVAADKAYRFIALKNIKKGEELTADYNRYSDSEMNKVWLAQKRVKAADRVQNPVLLERQRRRR